MLARLVDLHSFSKISSFDFAITQAMESLLAATLLAKMRTQREHCPGQMNS